MLWYNHQQQLYKSHLQIKILLQFTTTVLPEWADGFNNYKSTTRQPELSYPLNINTIFISNTPTARSETVSFSEHVKEVSKPFFVVLCPPTSGTRRVTVENLWLRVCTQGTVNVCIRTRRPAGCILFRVVWHGNVLSTTPLNHTLFSADVGYHNLPTDQTNRDKIHNVLLDRPTYLRATRQAILPLGLKGFIPPHVSIHQ